MIRWLAALGLAAGLHAVTPGEAPALPAPEPPTEGAEDGTEVQTPPEVPAATAEATNPYQAIIARNAFGLKDPPPIVPPPVKEVAPAVNVSALKLTGITTLLGKRAMFVFNDGKTNRISDLVREGERDRFITNLEVLEIDVVGRAVKVLFGEQEMRLDFVNNGVHPPTNLMAPGALPGGGMARPGGLPTVPAITHAGTPVAGGATAPIQAGATAYNVGGTRGSMPPRPNRLGVSAGGQGGANPTLQVAPTLSVDQQVAIFQEQHRVAREQNIPLPPAPPAPGLENLHQGVPVPPGLDGPPALPGQ